MLAEISGAGTSIWLDDLSRERMIKGGRATYLPDLISNDHVVGVTTNPAIFAASIANSDLYIEDIQRLAKKGASAEAIIRELTTSDVRQACDLFMRTFETSGGVDGRVSIEVDPRLARDTAGTIAEARELWQLVDRPNLLIKVPATQEGLPAIRTLISDGISVNVTIIFSVSRYREVLAAFIAGLSDRRQRGATIAGIHSVASFFISRVDTEIDPKLRTDSPALLGKAAIANARLAYQHFESVAASESWGELASAGGALQRPLWASTGVKDPAYDPRMYVLELVAPNTVNTMPEATLDALRSGGAFAGNQIRGNLATAATTISALAELGIDMDSVAAKLEEEGIAKFIKPWEELITTVEARR